MSDHVAGPSHDEEVTSGSSLQAHEARWMSHWMKRDHKPGPMVNNSSLVSYKDECVDQKSVLGQHGLKVEDGLPKSGKGASKASEEMIGLIDKKKIAVGQNNTTKSPSPSLTLSLCQNMENTSALRTPIDNAFGPKSTSLSLAIDQEENMRDLDLLQKDSLNSGGTHAVTDSYKEQKGISDPRCGASNKVGSPPCMGPGQSERADASSPVVVLEKHFSNDNFMCLGEGHCKYQKFSTIMFQEKNTRSNIGYELRRNDGLHVRDDPSMSKNFLPFFCKQKCESIQGHSATGLFPIRRNLDIEQGKLFHRCQPLDEIPCSVHNVETMKICTMVDSVENSPGSPPKISQRAHQFLFTKETRFNLSDGHQAFREPTLSAHPKDKNFAGSFGLSPDAGSSHRQGVKIQPLWSSTDSDEKKKSGDILTSKANSRNESSAETDAMQIDVHKDPRVLSGMASSPLTKDDEVDENTPPAALGSSMDKKRNKRPIIEMPDINEELPGLQPAVSSTDSMEPSTSRVHSLDAKRLFHCDEQTSKCEFNACKDPVLGPDSSNRWIKRLKRSSDDSLGVGTKSSEMGEASSNEKFGKFFNKITKCNGSTLDPMLIKHHGKERVGQNTDSSSKSGCSSRGSRKRNLSMMRDCSWIQRWSKHSTAPLPRNPEPLVICEPHSLKLGQEELEKKQFPSIAALALMGKAMNGFRPCEFRKRGSVVVWNTKEY